MQQHATILVLTGRVQGVGFRPFVYRLAKKYEINGWVRNTSGQVEVHIEGSAEKLDSFRRELIQGPQPSSQPIIESERAVALEHKAGFEIVPSDNREYTQIHLPLDLSLCAACESELGDRQNRRCDYPFLNCTQCGPRYTIINSMPYDRMNTSMQDFRLCRTCLGEYEAPDDRRFHAEPNACDNCGPQLNYSEPEFTINSNNTLAIAAAVDALHLGKILAVKGVGGYHLMCDAKNGRAIERLRRNKHRPTRPLAIMVPIAGDDQLGVVRELVEVDNKEVESELRSQIRPIVLLKKKPHSLISDRIAPGLDELGVMLPPSPMHLLLTEKFSGIVVATSGNISSEPVLTNDTEAKKRLQDVAEGWLIHNRRIVRPADDSIKRPIAGYPRTIRLGRGIAPMEYDLPTAVEHPVIAVGGHLKNTVALAWENRVVVSPHIGDLSGVRSMQVFEQTIEDLQRLYQVRAEAIVCDAHPQYASSRWANARSLPVYRVQHHRCHASSLAGSTVSSEEQLMASALMFTWDGIGFGDDGTFWGGEVFLGRPADWLRVGSFRNFRLAGGDRVSLEPWRSAAALHWELGERYAESKSARLLHAAWQKRINSIETSSAGRLFDAVASMLGLFNNCSYDGEAPMGIEAIADKVESPHSLPFNHDGDLLRIDWAPLFYAMKDEKRSVEYRAGYFHALLANTVVKVAQFLGTSHEIEYVGLTGGVFQNRKLTELTFHQLENAGLNCRLHTNIPANDGGLSFGQIIEYAATKARRLPNKFLSSGSLPIKK
jgi:hydrogenase maturation protein HypF